VAIVSIDLDKVISVVSNNKPLSPLVTKLVSNSSGKLLAGDMQANQVL